MSCNDQNPEISQNFCCEISDVRKTNNKPGMNRAAHLSSMVGFFFITCIHSEQRAGASDPTVIVIMSVRSACAALLLAFCVQ